MLISCFLNSVWLCYCYLFLTDIKLDELVVGNLFQEEYLTTSGVSIFKVSYFVQSDVRLVDSRTDTGITTRNLKSSLNSITVTSSSSTYGDFIYTGDVSTIFNLRYMVGLPIKQTVAPSTYNLFQTVLQDAWSQYSQGKVARS